MRHAAVVAAVAVAVAVVLVLVVAEEEAGEDMSTVTVTESVAAPPPPAETAPRAPAEERESEDVAQIEQAVALYVEAVELGEIRAEGLPTTDELSIRAVRVRGDHATAELAGGTSVSLRRVEGRWQVERR